MDFVALKALLDTPGQRLFGRMVEPRFLSDLTRKALAGHPGVLSGDDPPLGEGEQSAGADLPQMSWRGLENPHSRIPYPKREVRILNPVTAGS